MKSEPLTATQWHQLPLLEGGYDSLMVELTGHLSGATDQVRVGVVVTSAHSGEWISAVVPQIVVDLSRPSEAALEITKLFSALQRLLEPF